MWASKLLHIEEINTGWHFSVEAKREYCITQMWQNVLVEERKQLFLNFSWILLLCLHNTKSVFFCMGIMIWLLTIRAHA